jgi:hypothetical protein
MDLKSRQVQTAGGRGKHGLNLIPMPQPEDDVPAASNLPSFTIEDDMYFRTLSGLVECKTTSEHSMLLGIIIVLQKCQILQAFYLLRWADVIMTAGARCSELAPYESLLS